MQQQQHYEKPHQQQGTTSAAAGITLNSTTATTTPITATNTNTSTSTVATSVLMTGPSPHVPNLAGSVIVAEGLLLGGNNNNNNNNPMMNDKLYIRIQNLSSTANLGVRLDLKQIALKCRNTEFNPRRFGAVIMRLREPRATALLFASGKMVVTGVRSTHNATLAVQKFAYIMERIGFQPQEFLDFKVQNIVGTVDVGFPIRLEGLVYAHSAFASYEPELFPGLIYRLVNPRVVFLIFVSGKIVITGAKKESDLSHALTKLYPVLLEFAKKSSLSTSIAATATITAAATAAAPNSTTTAAAAASSSLKTSGVATKTSNIKAVSFAHRGGGGQQGSSTSNSNNRELEEV